MKKLLKTTICTLLAVATLATTAFAAEPVNWGRAMKIRNGGSIGYVNINDSSNDHNFTESDLAVIEKYGMKSDISATSDDITISVNRIVGDRHTCLVVLDVIRNDGKAFSKEANDYSFALQFMRQEAENKKNTHPDPDHPQQYIMDTTKNHMVQHLRLVDRDVNMNAEYSQWEWGPSNWNTGLSTGVFIDDNTNDNKIQLVYSMWIDPNSASEHNFIDKKLIIDIDGKFVKGYPKNRQESRANHRIIK